MASSTFNLLPPGGTGKIISGTWQNSGNFLASDADVYTDLVDDTTDTGKWLQIGDSAGTVALYTASVPADFASATDIRGNLHLNFPGAGDDTWSVSVQAFKSNGTALTTSFSIFSGSGAITDGNYFYTLNFTGTPVASDFTGAYIEVIIGYTRSMSADGRLMYLYNLTGNLNYTLIGPPTSAPAGLTAAATGSNILLTWSSLSGATDYTVQRSSDSGATWTSLGNSGNSTSFVDFIQVNGTLYDYRVAGQNAQGTGPYSYTSSINSTVVGPFVNQAEGSVGAAVTTSNSTGAGDTQFSAVTGTPKYASSPTPKFGNSTVYIPAASFVELPFTKSDTNTDARFIRFYAYFPTLTSTMTTIAAMFQGTMTFGTLGVSNSAINASNTSAAASIPSGQWVRFEMGMAPNFGCIVKAWYNPDSSGAPDATATSGTYVSSSNFSTRLGSSNSTIDMYIDQIALADHGWVGPAAVVATTPVSSTESGTLSTTESSSVKISGSTTDSGFISSTESSSLATLVSVVGTGSGYNAGSGTLTNLVLPSGIQSGDLIVIRMTHTQPLSGWQATGYTEIPDSVYNSGMLASVLVRVADGTEGGTSPSFSTLQTTTSGRCTAVAYVLRSVYGAPLNAGYGIVTSSSSWSSPAVNVAAGDMHIVVSGGQMTTAGSQPTWTAPSGYSNPVTANQTNTGGVNSSTFGAAKTYTSATSIPAQVSVSSDTGTGVTHSIAISSVTSPPKITSVSSSDVGSISVVESSSIFTILSTSDSGTASVSESASFATIPVSAIDAGSISVIEVSSFPPVAVSRTDSGTISVTESRSLSLISLMRNDSGNLSATETRVISAALSSSDSGLVSSIESRSFAPIAVMSVDSGTLSVSDSASFAPVTLSAYDSGALSVAESRSFAQVAVTGTDICSISTIESNSFSTVSVSGLDSGSISATESSIVNPVVPGNDTGLVTVNESISILATFASSDIGVLSVNDISLTFVPLASADFGSLTPIEQTAQATSLSSVDSGIVSASESGSFGLSPVSVSDSGALSAAESTVTFVSVSTQDAGQFYVGEARSFSTVVISTGDGGAISANDASAVYIDRPGQDSGLISAIESRTLAVSGAANSTAADNGTISAEESVSILGRETLVDYGTITANESSSVAISGTVIKASADAGVLSGVDATNTFSTLISTDSGAIGENSIASLSKSGLFAYSATDNGAISTVESTSGRGVLATGDSGSLSLSEDASIYSYLSRYSSVWDGSTWVQGMTYVWDGTQWQQAVMYVWDGQNWV